MPDIRLTKRMIEFPELEENSDVELGTDVIVHLFGGRSSHEFKVGDFANPARPRRVTWTKYATGPIINTGPCALALDDDLYDADGGWFGFLPVRKPQ